MSLSEEVAEHYTRGALLPSIRDAISLLGKSPENVTIEDLMAVDEFHIGARAASIHLLDQLELGPDHQVLDVGCGLGGTARFVADHYASSVNGVDLTHEFIETGNTLCEWVGVGAKVALQQGNATATDFADQSFDKAYMLHVGMNIADKAALMLEMARLLKPGATIGIYDIMRMNDGALEFPVPWSTTVQMSFVARPADYEDALTGAGFEVVTMTNRRDFALDYFARQRAKAAADGPQPLGLHLVMGENMPLKLQNLAKNVTLGRLAPVELIACRRS